MSNGELECITYVEENNKKEDNDNSNEKKNNENNNSNKNNHESNENKVINSDISKINKSAAEAIQPVKKKDEDCGINPLHKTKSETMKQKEDNLNLLEILRDGLNDNEIDNKNTIQIKENNKDFDNNDNSDYEGEFINDKKNENEKENEKKEDNKYNNEIQ